MFKHWQFHSFFYSLLDPLKKEKFFILLKASKTYRRKLEYFYHTFADILANHYIR